MGGVRGEYGADGAPVCVVMHINRDGGQVGRIGAGLQIADSDLDIAFVDECNLGRRSLRVPGDDGGLNQRALPYLGMDGGNGSINQRALPVAGQFINQPANQGAAANRFER